MQKRFSLFGLGLFSLLLGWGLGQVFLTRKAPDSLQPPHLSHSGSRPPGPNTLRPHSESTKTAPTPGAAAMPPTKVDPAIMGAAELYSRLEDPALLHWLRQAEAYSLLEKRFSQSWPTDTDTHHRPHETKELLIRSAWLRAMGRATRIDSTHWPETELTNFLIERLRREPLVLQRLALQVLQQGGPRFSLRSRNAVIGSSSPQVRHLASLPDESLLLGSFAK